MPILHALVLGIVQGLTEFLPISSSGHLELVPWLFGWNDLADDAVAKAFDTSLHLGTLIAVIFYMRAELGRYIVGGLTALRSPRRASTTGKAAWLFVGSAIPAGIVGLIAQRRIHPIGSADHQGHLLAQALPVLQPLGQIERAQALPVDTGTLQTMDDAAHMINVMRGASLPPASSLVTH